MKNIHRKNWDVVIAGGGPAGTIAAIASARNGATTLMVESTGCLGGMASSGLLSFWGAFDDRDRRLDRGLEKLIFRGLSVPVYPSPGRRIIKGIAEELLNRLIALNGARDWGTGCILVNPEILKYASEQMVLEEGANILYYTQVVDVEKKGEEIRAVVTGGKSGLNRLRSRVYVDATGDGDIAFFAGAPYEKGRPEDGRMQSVTLVFRLGGVKYRGRSYGFTHEAHVRRCNALFRKACRDGRVSGDYMVGCINSIPGMEGVVAVNSQHTCEIDGTEPADLTRAGITGRKQIREMAALFKKYLKGFEKSFLIDTAPLIGVRETRRFTGDYILTGEDVLGAIKFADGIGKGAWNIDRHIAPLKKETLAETMLKPGTNYDIPYRCLLPQRVNNLILSGRCISATHDALASLRIMPTCMTLGQAAGTAAALCARRKIRPRELDVSLLRSKLKAQGAYLREEQEQ